MAHYITAKQLESQYKHLLASSSEDNKRLWIIIEITCHRFHTDQRMSFVVEHKGIVVHISSYISLAIKAYNAIQHNEMPINNLAGLNKAHSCHDCAKQDNCNLFMRKGNQPACVNYKPE